MKLSCTKENLVAGLTIVSRVASKNLTLPILGNVLLRTDHGGLVLSATNLEVGVTVRVRGKVVEEGSITTQARLLNEYVNLLEHDRVELETEGNTMKIVGKDTHTTIRGLSSDDFPIIPSVAREHGATLSVETLKNSLNKVLFAAAQDSARPEISGVYLKQSAKKITLATTDSYRLAEAVFATEASTGDRNVIIPTRALYELVRIMPNQGTVEAFVGDTQALFVADGIELTTRLIEGQYPDYTQIIPKQSTIEAVVHKETLVKAVKTASLFCRQGINDVTIDLDPKNNTLSCAAANTELGEHRGSVPAQVTGGAASIVFNYRYLLDGLSVMDGEAVALGVTDSASPGVVRPVGNKDYLYLIMPIRQ